MNSDEKPGGSGILGMFQLFCILMDYEDKLNYCAPIFSTHMKGPQQAPVQAFGCCLHNSSHVI